MTLADFPQLQKLTKNQKLKLAEVLWLASIDDSKPMSAEHRRVVDSRWSAYRAGNRDYPVFQDSRNLMQVFSENGYLIYGTGKIDHGFHAEDWMGGDFGVHLDYGPWPSDGETKAIQGHPGLPAPLNERPYDGFGAIEDLPVFAHGVGGWRNYAGPNFPELDTPFNIQSSSGPDRLADERSADWAREILGSKQEQPFFLAVGLIKPHAPLYLPREYFDLYGERRLVPPTGPAPETVPPIARTALHPDDWGPDCFRAPTQTSDGSVLPDWCRAYLAAVTFTDEQLGRVLAALDTGPHANNTIVVLISDNGYHLGSRKRVFKGTLWDESTRVPFLFRLPGQSSTGVSLDRPVALVDLYPTLLDLVGLPSSRKVGELPLDGDSLAPFIRDPASTRNSTSVVHAYAPGTKELEFLEPGDVDDQHVSLINSTYRCIRYVDGSEELYDRKADPDETMNIAHEDTSQKFLVRFRRLRGSTD